MVKILIVDDNPEKLRRIKSVALKFPELTEENILCLGNSIDAKRQLSTQFYDLLILDINLPERPEDMPSAEVGINLLQELNVSRRLKKPYHIIGITAYDNIKASKNKNFEDNLWHIIKYDEKMVEWERILENKIQYLIQSKKDLLNPNSQSYEYDLAIITALRTPELEAILKLPAEWMAFREPNDSTEFHKGIFTKDDKKLRVVCASATQMGMVATAVLTDKILQYFRPKYIILCGIAAGIQKEGLNLGDILAPEFCFDYDSGKTIVINNVETFNPDHRQIPIDRDLLHYLQQCQAKRTYLNDIYSNWVSKKPSTVLNLHVGPFASGAQVIASNSRIESLKSYQRKLIGIDMETYGFYFAVENSAKPQPLGFFAAKSVSDYGGENKNDDYQSYASYTSANFAYQFALDFLGN